jgi:hypothetical protein
MKKKIFLKIAVCLGCAAMLLALNGILFNLCMKEKLNLVHTYIAAEDIPPRTKITEEYLVSAEIASDYLIDNTYLEKEDIIGKYTEIQGMIPAGSVFYKHMLYEEKDLPDHAQLQLKEGETSFGVQVDVASLGSLTEGERIDMHVGIERRDSTPLTGILIQNARIICIKDHQGLSLSNVKSNGVPYLMELAVQRTDLDLLNLAESVGTLKFFPSLDPYSTEPEASLVYDSDMTRYLQNMKESTAK